MAKTLEVKIRKTKELLPLLSFRWWAEGIACTGSNDEAN